MTNLDRNKIFPPFYNDPEELINPSKIKTTGPPRPPNGFLLCRKNVHKQAKERGICNMRAISKVTGILWRTASTDEKEQYEKLAIEKSLNLYHNHHHHQPYYIPQPMFVSNPIMPQQPIINGYEIPEFTQEDFQMLSLFL
ncbi:15043_t:CDS:2 [Entrophospora sp. SA101]|nr:13801_t:CDS:2 [Entrophospora sp. SA101]CAJ0628450.1 15043_t:CDS:2 [Entrophospora sp. SA101]CAJ0849925.1 531_t:CDS:2 [Entrophospora sp. SA101]CAJ0920749.1 2819_t:CDS:2 [Entrophospora sp. SA101]